MFEAFGGVPRMQQLHVIAKQLVQHRLDDEALQLLTKTLVVSSWGGIPAHQTSQEMRQMLAQLQRAREGDGRR